MRSGLLLLLVAAACAPQYTTAALGQYDEFQPFMHVERADTRVEIARPAYVSVVVVRPPAGGFEEEPVTFSAVYPLYESDRVHFPAGQHRLIPRRTNFIEPRVCRTEEKPSVTGCRRRQDLLPGMRPGPAVPRGPLHYIVIAAEELVDPFELADELHFQALENRELAATLRASNAAAIAPHVERILLDRRGTPVWSAIYIATR